MLITDRARWIARGVGLAMSQSYSDRFWKRQFVEQLQQNSTDVILDVGANAGQYGRRLRKLGFKKRIVSFEPLSEPFSRLAAEASGDPLWDCQKLALGDTEGTASINIAGNSAESSSVLPMLQRHQDAYPPANYVGKEEVSVRRLDTVAVDLLRPADRVFLKVDVQGFEKQVLIGGDSTVKNHCVGLQLELSFLPLYEGAMLIPEALELVYSMGFTLTGLLPCFIDPRNGQMLQADGIFFRSSD